MEQGKVALALAFGVCVLGALVASVMLIEESGESATIVEGIVDPLIQVEGHDHRNASQHVLYTDNIMPVSYNPLTAPGNAEVQVADSPDGNTYAYIAGWSEMHIVDVTNPANTTVTGVYYDPNTQVLDVKYLQYNAREYVICLLYTSPSPRDQ